MSTDQEAIIEKRVNDVLRTLQLVGGSDGEAMFMVGTLAGRMLVDSRLASWPAMKRRLSAAEYDQLLLTTQIQGNELAAEGHAKAAFALDVVITSIVASRLDTPRITRGVALIDEAIERAVSAWRASNAPTPTN